MAFPADHTVLAKLDVVKSQVNGTHNSFVAYVNESSFGAEKSNIFANSDNGGGDVRFSTDESGTNQIPLHVMFWDTSTETCLCVVKLDGVSDTTDATVYVWADNAGETQPAVTDTYGRNAVYSDFHAYFPFDDIVLGGAVNVVGNSSDATVPTGGAVSVQQNGKLYYAYEFNGSQVEIAPDDTTTPDYWNAGFSQVTYSSWVYFDNTQPDSFGVIMEQGGTGNGFAMLISNTGTIRAVEATGGFVNSSSSCPNLTWCKVDVTYSAGTCKIYLDGVLDTTDTTTMGSSVGNHGNPPGIGKENGQVAGGVGGRIKGRLESLSRFPTAKSDSLIETEYNNQNDPSAFWSASAIGGGAVEVTDTITTSESATNADTVQLVGQFNISDSTTSTKSSNNQDTITFASAVNVADSVTASKSIVNNDTVKLVGAFEVSDSVVTSKSTNNQDSVVFGAVVNVSDSVTSSESTTNNDTVKLVGAFNVVDSTVTSESSTNSDSIAFASTVIVNDSVTTSKSSNNPDAVKLVGAFVVSDSTSVSESNCNQDDIKLVGEFVITDTVATSGSSCNQDSVIIGELAFTYSSDTNYNQPFLSTSFAQDYLSRVYIQPDLSTNYSQ